MWNIEMLLVDLWLIKIWVYLTLIDCLIPLYEIILYNFAWNFYSIPYTNYTSWSKQIISYNDQITNKQLLVTEDAFH